jgi:hypothetical protein
MPVGLGLGKITSLVICLCKINNFCIDNRDVKATSLVTQVEITMRSEGAIPRDGDQQIPTELLNQAPTLRQDGGALLLAQNRRMENGGRLRMATGATDVVPLPRDSLLDLVIQKEVTSITT